MERTGRRAIGPMIAVVAILGLLGAAAVMAVLNALGVWQDSDEAKVNIVLGQYLRQVGDENYDRACGYLADSLKAELGGDCAATLRQRYAGMRSLSSSTRDHLENVDARTVTVNGSTATVADGDLRFEITETRRNKKTGKNETHTWYENAPDLTFGTGFAFTKTGEDWRITEI
jgi:hypothetical protein